MKTDKELGVNSVNPRAYDDLRVACNDCNWLRVDPSDLRQRIVFFALNCSDDNLSQFSQTVSGFGPGPLQTGDK